jgi:hypothetical protein
VGRHRSNRCGEHRHWDLHVRVANTARRDRRSRGYLGASAAHGNVGA